MKTLRELFSLHHAGFQDFGTWYEHHKAIHATHHLDVPEFGAEWLRRWEAVGRLLEKPSMVGVRQGNTERVEWYKLSAKYGRTVAHCLTHAIERRRVDPKLPMVARLLDGTIIREWGPK